MTESDRGTALVGEPINGFFTVLRPGNNIQHATDRCPPGESILLTPGVYTLKRGLKIVKAINIFGRDATLELWGEDGETDAIIHSTADAAIIGVVMRESERLQDMHNPTMVTAFKVIGGSLHIQSCKVEEMIGGVFVNDANVTVVDCEIKTLNIVTAYSAKVNIERCKLFSVCDYGIMASGPQTRLTIRDSQLFYGCDMIDITKGATLIMERNVVDGCNRALVLRRINFRESRIVDNKFCVYQHGITIVAPATRKNAWPRFACIKNNDCVHPDGHVIANAIVNAATDNNDFMD